MKVCGTCKTEKSLGEFYGKLQNSPNGVSGTTWVGTSSECKPCLRARRKLYVINNPDKVKNLELKRSFGITLGQYNEMFSMQNGCCAVCNRHQSEFKLALAVDHCHMTQKIRGLLCMHCNQGLGQFQDSPNILLSAIQYLAK